MSITSYKRNCGKSAAGNAPGLYIGLYPEVKTSATFSVVDGADQISTLVMTNFKRVQTDFDSILYNAEPEANRRSYINMQTMELKISGKRTETEKLLFEIEKAIPCNLVLIRSDKNGKFWLSGLAPATALGNRAWSRYTENFTTGESITDIDEGNSYTITLERDSVTPEYEITDEAAIAILRNLNA